MVDIEYFYAAHSAFAYVGSARLMSIAEAAGARLVHRPYDLNHVLEHLGVGGFSDRTEQHRAYYFGREIERWAELRDVEWIGRRPTHHSNDYTLANRMLIAGLEQGLNIDRLAHAMLERHWREDADLSNRATLGDIARRVDIDPEPLLTAASSDRVEAIHRENTEAAIQRSVFGSPTYFVGGDMFYGQDHLELVERALRQPFSGAWPPEAAI